MDTLVLHIGPHKTGSTYIQKRLLENRDAFAAMGVVYPDVGIDIQYGHHRIAELAKHRDAEGLRQILGSVETAQARCLILSSENFDQLGVDEIAEFKGILPEAGEVRVIYYVRNPTDMLLSIWQENVKHGATRSFFEFAEPHISRPLASALLNNTIVLDRYRKVFGAERIRVLNYDGNPGTDMFSGFAAACGHPAMAEHGQFKWVNKSMPPWEVEVIRALNILALLDGRLNGANVRTAWLALRKAGNPVVELLPELESIIMARTQSFNLEGSVIEKLLQKTLLGAYEIWSADAAAPSLGSTKSEIANVPVCSWQLDGRGGEIVKAVYAELVGSLPKLPAAEKAALPDD